MPKPLKYLYTPSFFEDLIQTLPKADVVWFTTLIFDNKWAEKELKQRMRQVNRV